MLIGPERPVAENPSLSDRVRRTLEIAHRWGYALTPDGLAEILVGGAVPTQKVLEAIHGMHGVAYRMGFVHRVGFGDLVERSNERVVAHQIRNGWARRVAERYAMDLVRTCPLVTCVSLAGSAASGGFAGDDDIDFDLLVADDAKYLVYAFALLLGLRVSLRNRKGLRKVICINVLWTRSESMPFQRQDEDLAFELLHCKPLVGFDEFRRVIAANEWAREIFPQLGETVAGNGPLPEPGWVGRTIHWIGVHPGLLRSLNEASRIATHAVYSFTHWLTRHDAEKTRRLEFLQRVKYPYEVFQD